jgi:hypothetical protein
MSKVKIRKGIQTTLEEKNVKISWAGFVETTIVNFFQEHELEKLSLEDGKGNKAKLTKQKDNVIKVEYTSTTTL